MSGIRSRPRTSRGVPTMASGIAGRPMSRLRWSSCRRQLLDLGLGRAPLFPPSDMSAGGLTRPLWRCPLHCIRARKRNGEKLPCPVIPHPTQRSHSPAAVWIPKADASSAARRPLPPISGTRQHLGTRCSSVAQQPCQIDPTTKHSRLSPLIQMVWQRSTPAPWIRWVASSPRAGVLWIFLGVKRPSVD